MEVESHDLQLILAGITRSPDLLNRQFYASPVSRSLSIPCSHTRHEGSHLCRIHPLTCKFTNLIVKSAVEHIARHRCTSSLFIGLIKTIRSIHTTTIVGS